MKRIMDVDIVICLGLALAAGLPKSALAGDTVVNIQLQDSTTSSGIQNMQMLLDHAVVPAGRVTLRAKNESKQLIHEVLVFRDSGKPLPYNESSGRIVEKQAHSLGEVSDLKPGKSGQKTFSLSPGTYYLICNQPMHLKGGMYARLKVVAGNAPIGGADGNAVSTAPPETKSVK